MGRRITILLAVLLLLTAAQAAWSFDANLAADGYVDGPAVGSPAGATYTSTWTVQPLAGWESGWLLVELEFQPDGTPEPGYTSLAHPLGFDPLENPNDGWIGWYLTEADYGTFGLDSTAVVGEVWKAQYTPTGDINAMNYHIRFAKQRDDGSWQTNQLSKTADPGNGEVPEPTSLVLLAMGLTGTVGMIRRKRAH
jgi:hypothetical protein